MISEASICGGMSVCVWRGGGQTTSGTPPGSLGALRETPGLLPGEETTEFQTSQFWGRTKCQKTYVLS